MSTLSKKDSFFSSTSPELDELFSKDILGYTQKELRKLEATLPSANIDESEKEYTIELAVPGMKKEDLNVELRQNVLTISSEKKVEKEEKDEKKNFKQEGGSTFRCCPLICYFFGFLNISFCYNEPC